ncbi:hypothetical protein [Taklimakanibacter deserti]|uniref:hypothetical protein n=1 Tax=Taklimakanibacter deserti TaxID=2267839 RepID=UPI000E6464E2
METITKGEVLTVIREAGVAAGSRIRTDDVKVAVEGHLDLGTLTRRLNDLVAKRARKDQMLREQAR